MLRVGGLAQTVRQRWEVRQTIPPRAVARAGALPKGLLGAIGLIVVIEYVGLVPLMVRIPDSCDRVTSSWMASNRATLGPEARAEILCFGDSLIKLGILPRVLEDRLGMSAYNLAILGGQAPTSYFLLVQVLEQGHRPRALIVNFSPLLLATDPRVNLEWWSRWPTDWERLELWWRAGDPALAGSMAIQALIASWSSRDAVRSALGLEVGTALAGNHTATTDDPRIFERNWRMNRGAQVAPRPYVPIAGALTRPYEGNRWRWRPHPAHAFYLERFLTLAEAHHIPVYWVLTPAVSTWLERNDGVGTIGAYRQFVRRQQSRFPGLIVLDAQRAAWERSAFRDPVHLNRDGAVRLSLAVAESIARRSDLSADRARWIELEGYADRSSNRFQSLLEDLDQSRLAVNQRGNSPGTKEGSR
jgi:hypothetical protein